MPSVILGFVQRLRSAIVRNGVAYVVKKTMRTAFHTLRDRLLFRPVVATRDPNGPRFDRECALDTQERFTDVQALAEMPSEAVVHGYTYSPSDPDTVRLLVDKLQIPYEDYAFVDFGSGKGRVLFIAAEYPFRRVVGVEHSGYLHSVAQNNIAKYSNPKRQCKDIQSCNIDARSFPLPSGPTVYFFFNPFDSLVLRHVLERINESLSASPHKDYVVCYHVNDEQLFRAHRARELWRHSNGFGTHILFELE